MSLLRFGIVWTAFFSISGVAGAQFDLQSSGTKASLRGVDSLGDGVAWASGANGTVLRTVDGGARWQVCAVPKGAEKLDFRGVQAFDAQTAVVMASGKGAASKIYRTADGCATWKQVFENPDADGFFDSMKKVTGRQMYVLGDPVGGKFAMFFSPDQGLNWFIADDPGLEADKGDGGFAASNSLITVVGSTLYFGTGGTGKPHVYSTYGKCPDGAGKDAACPMAWQREDVPVAEGSAGAGVFSVASRTTTNQAGKVSALLVAVGGDYEKADVSAGTAAFSRDGGAHWTPAETMPAGYRSAVVFDRGSGAWLAVGPSGTDLSRDNGVHWTAIAGENAAGWNAIALPFAVGSGGKIGKVQAGVLEGH